MTITAIPANNSIAKRALYNPNQRVNSKTIGPIPGLEDDILVYPKALSTIIRELFTLNSGEIQWFGCDIPSFTNTTINTLKGGLIKDDEVYFLEALSLQPTAQAFWGFYEIELVQQDSDLANLQFFDVSTNSTFQQNANTRKSFIIKVYENYNTTAAFPTLTSGRIKWFEYKKDNAFGNIISVNKTSYSIKLPKNKNGTLLTIEDFFLMAVTSVNGQTGTVFIDSIPLGTIIEDALDQFDPARYKETNGQSYSRSTYSALWNLINRSITSITPATDRINSNSHGRVEGDLVKFSFTGGGITALTSYYVRNPTSNDFQISVTKTGAIVDLTSSQSGTMLVNTEYGFGDGSTTFNVPDRRGIFPRGAGVHGTRAKASGGNYDGGAVGYESRDQLQGFVIQGVSNGGSAVQPGGSIGTGNPLSPVSDGTNGTPRIGNETTPASVGVRFKVRIA
ncbi:phage tail collar domain protein [Leptospira santarosai str. CBC379]|uniref:tail fiber protein n=1 Tax=Leptospira santarosai TaxID=28183 RepID=UPI00029772C6|nr:tail fiber protein [Leptospira santarosai]EKR89678.1 phage tail collar domain protein [Leptospira santarosai str. CBC379]